jgi:phosphatidylserine decarboxylase
MSWGDEPYIVKEAYPFIAFFAFLTLFAAASRLGSLSWILLLATLCVTAFFRNPPRTIPEDPKAIVCPADGKILNVENPPPSNLLSVPSQKISIFMSPFDVHVNRVPASGTVNRRSHMPGRFHVASTAEASSENERVELLIETPEGFTVGLVQIAGRVARRIVCYPRVGDRVEKGERFGLIRFGSRVELFLPQEVCVSVEPGQRVKGGETVMGYFP